MESFWYNADLAFQDLRKAPNEEDEGETLRMSSSALRFCVVNARSLFPSEGGQGS